MVIRLRVRGARGSECDSVSASVIVIGYRHSRQLQCLAESKRTNNNYNVTGYVI